MKSSLYLIGLTGNIACGKSTVLAMLRERGAQVIDADLVVHDLQQPGQAVYLDIVAAFGDNILVTQGGPIDRRKLGAIVFSDPLALRQLEQIVHPAVHKYIIAWLDRLSLQRDETSDTARSPQVVVIDAIKLLESGWKPFCDAIWVVTCITEQQLKRLMTTRGMSEAEARTRITAQPPQADKIAQADVVIDNSRSLEETRQQIDAAWQAIRKKQELRTEKQELRTENQEPRIEDYEG